MLGRLVSVLFLFGWAACGRYHFTDLDLATDGAVSDGAAVSDVDAESGLQAHYVQSFVGTGAGTMSTFSVTPVRIGDALVVQTYCGSSSKPTEVVLEAPGWTFERVSPIVGAGVAKDFVASFVAVVPSIETTVVTATWSVAACDLGLGSVGDEFADTADQLLDLVLDHAEAFGVNDCATAVATAPGDLVWGACTGNVVAIGPAFSKGADDNGGDWTEYRTAAVAAAATPVTFANAPGQDFVITAVTLRHR
ncbi:hypothetical protein BH11MYX1_BH11MYX1_28540 [soil metagenome]